MDTRTARTLSPSGATKICHDLSDAVRHGVAFHHAGLKPGQREIVEQNFKKNLIRVICSTPTLAAGVNLPARRAVIRDYKRFESGLGSAFIPVSEYKQCAGRAGRPQFDTFGEAVLIAKTSGEARTLMDRYIKAEPEPLKSKLGDETVLRFHILASIAGGYLHDINDTFDFLSKTFLWHQKLLPQLLEVIGEIFDFLSREGFIEKQGFRYTATPFGQLTSRLYLDPGSALVLRSGLKKIHAGHPGFSAIGVLHMIAACPDNPLLKVGTKDQEDIEFFLSSFSDELIVTADDAPALDDYLTFLSVAKTVLMLSCWIDEEREEKICDRFGIGPGDVYRHIESMEWLLNAALAFTELFEYGRIGWPLSLLKSRVKYGIKEELAELTRLKGIGRVRARNLYEKGYRTITDLKKADTDDIAGVDKIGNTLAREIKDQIKTVP